MKESACTPLFWNAFTMRDARACIHTHSQHAGTRSVLLSSRNRANSKTGRSDAHPSSPRRRLGPRNLPNLPPRNDQRHPSRRNRFHTLIRLDPRNPHHREHMQRRGSDGRDGACDGEVSRGGGCFGEEAWGLCLGWKLGAGQDAGGVFGLFV